MDQEKQLSLPPVSFYRNFTRLKKKGFFFYLFLCVLIWVYLWLRAIYVPMVHDEIATFFYNVQTSRFLPFFSHWDMNNHVLNSGLSTLFYHVFGFSPLVLRLANLLAFPVFCLFLWKISNLFTNPLVKWWLLICLLMTQGFIEFFGLSRGYGISMALMSGMLFFLLKATMNFSIRGLFTTLLWAFFATFSNLALINTYLIVIFWLFLLLLSGKDGLIPRKKIIPILSFCAFCLFSVFIFALISLKAREMGLLYTGGSEGFNEITLKSLLVIFLNINVTEIHYFLGLFFILLLEYSVYKILRRRTLFQGTVLLFTLLAGNILAYWLLNIIFGVNYPENRVAIYLLPLFLLALGLAVDDFIQVSGKKIFLFFLIPFLMLPALFPFKMNLMTTESYFKDPVSTAFYEKIKKSHLEQDYPSTVGGNRLYLLCWSFQDYSTGGTESPLTWHDYPGKIADFQVVDARDLPLFIKDYQVIDQYPASSMYLLERVPLLKKIAVFQQQGIRTGPDNKDEYFNLIRLKVDSLIGKSLYIGYEGKIHSDQVPFEAWIVADVKDASGKSLQYVNFGLNWHRKCWKGTSSYIKNGLVLNELPLGSETLVLYLWNINKVPFSIKDFNATLFRYSN